MNVDNVFRAQELTPVVIERIAEAMSGLVIRVAMAQPSLSQMPVQGREAVVFVDQETGVEFQIDVRVSACQV